jgi:hypothetical protein
MNFWCYKNLQKHYGFIHVCQIIAKIMHLFGMLFLCRNHLSRMMIQELIQLLDVGVYHQAFAGTILAPFLSSLVKVLGDSFAFG